ncbi:hypothetical protein OFAG_01097 [Oxalobacter formigenes HOxBLS]|uniref:Uncharacterized protein n=1 Tax=Oxalobacter paraformigenes TaxID=556268 RepID=C3X408_9BURK|nr:hypothetical protein OFAG_01097 [Oxalobacter paraformigenes]
MCVTCHAVLAACVGMRFSDYSNYFVAVRKNSLPLPVPPALPRRGPNRTGRKDAYLRRARQVRDGGNASTGGKTARKAARAAVQSPKRLAPPGSSWRFRIPDTGLRTDPPDACAGVKRGRYQKEPFFKRLSGMSPVSKTGRFAACSGMSDPLSLTDCAFTRTAKSCPALATGRKNRPAKLSAPLFPGRTDSGGPLFRQRGNAARKKRPARSHLCQDNIQDSVCPGKTGLWKTRGKESSAIFAPS